jgi:hypothetical protein
MARMTNSFLALLILEWSPPLSAGGDYPINRCVQVETEHRFRAYAYSAPVYIPERGQIMHWGAIRNIYLVPLENRNDVLRADQRGQGNDDHASRFDAMKQLRLTRHGFGSARASCPNA